MPTEDGFAPDDRLPLFLSGHADQREMRDSPLLLNAGILVATMTLIGIVMALSLGNPVKVFAGVNAALTDTSVPRPAALQPTTAIQSTADARASPPNAAGASGRDEVPATFAGADVKQAEASEVSPAALLKQFQAWAAEQDEPAQTKPVPPTEDAPPQVAPVPPVEAAATRDLQDARASVRPVQKHRRSRPVQNARAEVRPLRNPRARLQRDRNAPVDVRPIQDVRAQGQPVQNARSPSFFQSLGWSQPSDSAPARLMPAPGQH